MEVIQRNILSSIRLKAREVEEEAPGNSEVKTILKTKVSENAPSRSGYFISPIN